MTLEEALQEPNWGRTKCEAGVFHRRAVRTMLDYLELGWKEYKGLLNSYFVIAGPKDRVERFREWMFANGAERM